MKTKNYQPCYSHHIPDKIVRSVLPQTSLKLSNCNPDGMLLIDYPCIVVFEYENSGRGMLAHTVKYLHLVDTNKLLLKVCFIESLYHQQVHRKDAQMSKFCSKFASQINSDKRNISFDFKLCDGTLDNILHIENVVYQETYRELSYFKANGLWPK